MSSAPRRNRQNLHMDFTALVYAGSPCPTPRATFSSTPDIPQRSSSRQSSIQSSNEKPPSIHSGTPRYSTSDDEIDDEPARRRYGWFWIRHGLTGRVFLLWILLFSFFVWYCFRGRTDLDLIRNGVGEFNLKSAFFEDSATKGLQFIPAAHSRIHASSSLESHKTLLIGSSTWVAGHQHPTACVWMGLSLVWLAFFIAV